MLGKDRVAGFDADVVQLEPRDGLRFGYRIWSERRSGLVVKLQTVDGDGRVIEQSAFSELQLDAPVKVQALAQMMGSTAGYRVEKSELERTTASKEGWTLKAPVRRLQAGQLLPARAWGGGGVQGHTMQWTFSDGLASVSLFVEPYDAQRQPQEVAARARRHLHADAPAGGQGWRLVAHCRWRSAAADAGCVCAEALFASALRAEP